MPKKVLIVGGVAGGATAAARLRRIDENAQIIMFERGEYISFANCGLPYYVGEVIREKEKLTLQTPESFHSRFNVDVRILNEVTSIDRGEKKVSVKNHSTGETYSESYDYLILSPGAEPFRPRIEGADLDRVFTLRNIPDTYKVKDFVDHYHPRRAVVIGGGYIGIEMAENLHHLGLEVSIVELLDHVVGPLDYDMACELHRHIRSKGVSLFLNNGVKAIRGEEIVTVDLNDSSIETDIVIMAVGVRPESGIAKQAGLEVNESGAIITDDHMKTNDEFIYAIGDAVAVKNYVSGKQSFIPLAGPANKQGRIVADNISGKDKKYDGTQGSAILKCFDMTVACTGLNERDIEAAGFHYEKTFTFSGSHASYYPGSTFMSLKLLFDPEDGRIFGAQCVGYDGVDKRIDVIATAMRAHMTVEDLTELELCYAPPFSAAKDPVNMIGFVAQNIINGESRIFHWHDIENLDLSKVTLLDVRTAIEYENGTIPGAINIPLDELRERINEIDRTKPVYEFCQVGLRGYVAERILKQNGFDVFNLAGGYRLYHQIFSNEPTMLTNATIAAKAEEKEMELVEKGTAAEKNVKTIEVDACGLQCPGPIMRLYGIMKEASVGDIIEIKATDAGFGPDAEAWCRRTGNVFEGITTNNGNITVRIKKTQPSETENKVTVSNSDNAKNIVLFSGDLDKAIAAFIIANGAAAMGRKVSIFFTFWGLNILRKGEKIRTQKNFIEKMFGFMMPRGSKKLSLSKMNMGGMGAAMIRGIMKKKNVDSMEDLIKMALENGVELVACNMSMDIMGIHKEELIDGVKLGGVASMLANAEESDMSMFI